MVLKRYFGDTSEMLCVLVAFGRKYCVNGFRRRFCDRCLDKVLEWYLAKQDMIFNFRVLTLT